VPVLWPALKAQLRCAGREGSALEGAPTPLGGIWPSSWVYCLDPNSCRIAVTRGWGGGLPFGLWRVTSLCVAKERPLKERPAPPIRSPSTRHQVQLYVSTGLP